MNNFRHCKALRRLLRNAFEVITLAATIAIPFAIYFAQMKP